MGKNYLIFFSFVVLLFFVMSCTPQQQPATATPKAEEKVVEKPSEEVQPKTVIAPQKQISAEIKDLLSKSKTRVSSIYYKYRGPETGTDFDEFYIKGDKIKYRPAREIQSLDQPNSFDTIFIDTTAKTAYSYCEAAYCKVHGKKADLNYDSAYIQTVFDWINVNQAEKIGEEVIESRNTWKLQTNKGVVWVDVFYGVPLKAEADGKTYRFEQIAVNSVKDTDIVPSS